MKAQILLADSAQQDSAGKVHALGLGWSVTGSPTPPSAIVVLIKVPWDQTNVRHRFKIELLDGDGHLAQVAQDPTGQQFGAMQIEGQFEAGRPPGLPPGTAIDSQVAINIGPLGLPPNNSYEWRLTINDELHEDWSARFYVAPPPPMQPQQF